MKYIIYLMIMFLITKHRVKNLKDEWEKIVMLLLPLIPHIAHEFADKLNKNFYWPKYDLKLLEEENCNIVIQVDGKKKRYGRNAKKFRRKRGHK